MGAESTGSLSEAFARRLAAFRLADVPLDVRRKAELVLLDTIGEMVASASRPQRTTRALSQLFPAAAGQATVVGGGSIGSAMDAAYLNAALAAAGLRDCLHVPTTMHAPAVVAAAVIAVAEPGRTSGADLLAAFILGVEVACRVSDALDPACVYERGFHPTAVCGTFGAAIGAASLLGPGGEEVAAAALGLALQHAGGHGIWLRDASDGMRALSPAIGARNGVTAALVGAAGVANAVQPFDGADGVLMTFSARPRPERLLQAWGERFFVGEMTYKLHASCTYTHAALDALLALHRRHGFAPDAVVAIRVRLPAGALAATTRPALRSCFAPHVLALGLTAGAAAIGDIGAAHDDDPLFRRLVEVVDVTADPDATDGSASVAIALTDGSELREHVTAARGTLANPLTEGEIVAKYDSAVHGALAPSVAAAIRDDILTIARFEDIAPLFGRLRQHNA